MAITQEKTEGLKVKDFKSEQKSTWCAGCGDFGILSAVQTALVNSGMAPWQVMLVSGIGCGSKLPDYINANGYMTLHGRGVAIGAGVHLANTDLVTMVITGDGDGLGIGLGHAVHNMRRNMDIVHIIEDNEVYGLTKGQYSPTSKRGFKTSTSPEGAIEFAIDPISMALSAGATFIACSYSGSPKHSAEMIRQAMEHKGYSLVRIYQTCPSYNKLQNNEWYKERTYEISDEIPDYDPTDVMSAYELALRDDGRYPMGVVYRAERPTYAEQVPAFQKDARALVKHDLELDAEFFEQIKMSYM
jgi:2-oxoglutarate ferredoxin oxidoreductase subunit beta